MALTATATKALREEVQHVIGMKSPTIIVLNPSISNIMFVVKFKDTITQAFGTDCTNIRQIVHLGSPDDVEAYIQETGQAGRDGQRSLGALLLLKGARHQMEKNIVWLLSHGLCVIIHDIVLLAGFR